MLDNILNLIFPLKCACCSTLLNNRVDIEICDKCILLIPFFNEDYINIEDIDIIYFDKLTSACRYSGVLRECILRYKFGGKPSYYRALAKLLFAKICCLEDYLLADGFISVPMYRKKKNERGYNQAELLCIQLSSLSGLPNFSNCIVRNRKTYTQSLLSKEEREKNVLDSFEIKNQEKIRGKKLILIDDIMTTGSTLNECAKVLKNHAVERVYGAVVATGKVSFS